MAVQIGGGNGVVTSNRETSVDFSREQESLTLLRDLSERPIEVKTKSREIIEIIDHPQVSRQELQLVSNLNFSGCRTTTRREWGLPIAGETRSIIFDYAIQNIGSLVKQMQNETRIFNRSQGSSESSLDLKLEAFVNILKHLQLSPGKEFGFRESNLNKAFGKLLSLIEAHKGMENSATMLLPLKEKASPEIAQRITSLAPTTNLYF